MDSNSSEKDLPFNDPLDRDSLLADKTARSLIGVVDLAKNQAVHAVAGQRQQYRPITVGPAKGDAVALANHYFALGLWQLYIADLDAIGGGPNQTQLIVKLLHAQPWARVLIDIGWCGDAAQASFADKLTQHSAATVVAASESLDNPQSLRALTNIVSTSRVCVSFDFRSGVFVSQFGDFQQWLDLCRELQITQTIVLDVGSVGTGNVSVHQHCRTVRDRLPEAKIYSGGGIRSADDVRQLQQSGCNDCLVATALLPE